MSHNNYCIMSPISPLIENFFLFSMPLFGVLALILWFTRTNHVKANRILMVITIFCMIDAWFYSVYLPNPEIAYQYTFLHGFDSTSMFLILPGFYVYIQNLFNKVMGADIKLWPHLVPFFIVFMIDGIYNFSSIESKKVILDIFYSGQAQIYSDLPKIHQVLVVIDAFGFWFMLLVYAILAYQLRKRYLTTIGNIFSDTDKLMLDWVNSIIYLFYLLFTFYTLVLIAPFLLSPDHSILYLNLHLGVIGIIYLYIVIQGAIHPFTYTKRILTEVKKYRNATQEGEYKSSSLTPQNVEEIKVKLLKVMDEKQPYLDSNLTVNQLAEILELSNSRELSQVLSQSLELNFNQFINSYRVKAAKNYIDAYPGTKTMLTISLEVGFNSLSSFYSHFKQLTGIAPKQYEKKILSAK